MTHDALGLGWLVESALRSLALGAGVFLLIKLARLRDLAAETLIWTAVLAGAMAMPMLSVWLPGRILVPLPAAPMPIYAPATGLAAPSPAPLAFAGLGWAVYGVIAVGGLARLATGLILTVRLYRAAKPVPEAWAQGRKIRFTEAVSGPFTVAGAILLPSDYGSWPEAKRLAVLAHEEAHIHRRDFYILVFAALHRALFWFNPFAWWLEWKLRELAERASDQAAIGRIQDAPGYAEILLETARAARRLPALTAMARGPGVAWRVDHILRSRPAQRIGAPARLGAVAAVLATALTVAGIQAAVAGTQTSSFVRAGMRPSAGRAVLIKLADQTTPRPARTSKRVPRAHAATPSPATSASSLPPPAAPIAYNPRALIEDPDAAVLPALVAAGGGRGVLVPQLSRTGSGH